MGISIKSITDERERYTKKNKSKAVFKICIFKVNVPRIKKHVSL